MNYYHPLDHCAQHNKIGGGEERKASINQKELPTTATHTLYTIYILLCPWVFA